MSSNNDLTTFLKNTEKALKKCTVPELNEAVEAFLKTRNENTEGIAIVLELVADTYNLTTRTLTTSNTRGKVQVARMMAYCLLHFDLGLNTRYIAKRIFGKWQNSVNLGILYYKRLDANIKTSKDSLLKEDKEFMENYERLQLKIKNK